jgi:NAD(P)-dependent dehydrogenase (short-subunit alcohol dehydrogenase family)
MDLRLTGKSVLITGGSKGIGYACAESFAAEGCNVHLAARSRQNLDEARNRLHQRFNVSVDLHAVDLADGDAARGLVKACSDVDILVNNAGAIPRGDVETIDEAKWREVWNLKVFGYINMTRAMLTEMKSRKRGVIVNIIGLAGEMPNYDYAAGSMGNASLMMFTRTVGSKSIESGVRVVAINPPATRTDRLVTLFRAQAQKELGNPDRWPELTRHLPMGRPCEPQEIADLAVFLASDRSAYTSGVVFTVDGGLSARH